MFDIASGRLAWIPVNFKVLRSNGDEAAEYVHFKVMLKVDLLDRDDFKKLGQPAAEGEREKTEIEQFKELVKDWRDVGDKGRPAPFEDAAIARLLAWPGFTDAFNQAYTEAWVGVLELREKNSDGSGENGPAAPDQAQ